MKYSVVGSENDFLFHYIDDYSSCWCNPVISFQRDLDGEFLFVYHRGATA